MFSWEKEVSRLMRRSGSRVFGCMCRDLPSCFRIGLMTGRLVLCVRDGVLMDGMRKEPLPLPVRAAKEKREQCVLAHCPMLTATLLKDIAGQFFDRSIKSGKEDVCFEKGWFAAGGRCQTCFCQ